MAKLNYNHQNDVRELLASLVKINSVNENEEQANRDRAEEAVSKHVESLLVDLGMEVTRHPLAPGRDNLVAHWPDQTGEKSIAFQSHMDTVGVTGMTIDPFRAGILDGNIWGRGACDTKGSMAAFLMALRLAKKKGIRPKDKVYFVATVAEETGCKGAESLVEGGFSVDAMVVGEPTESKLVTAHKGTCWATLTSGGTSCHASLPHLGHNAIYGMSKALRFLEEEYIPGLQKREHPLLGAPTLSVGTIDGGTVTNVVPSSCRCTLDLRILPGDDPETVFADLLERVRASVPGEEFGLESVHAQTGVEIPNDSPWVQSLLGPCQKKAGQEAGEGVNYYADSGPFYAAGIPCVLFGPGAIDQAHTKDEFLDLDQLFLSTEIALEWLEIGVEASLLEVRG